MKLCYYNNPVLRKKCAPIEQITDELKSFIKDLEETMDSYNGLGIAAPQVGRSIALFLVRYPIHDEEGHYERAPTRVFINPKLSNPSKETWSHEEGCLSIPKVYGQVIRPEKITVQALDINGNVFTEELSGWAARVVMHENDHINGVLFIDRLSKKERHLIDAAIRQIDKTYNY